MFDRFDTETAEAAIALTLAAGGAGVVVGYGAAERPDLVFGVGSLALAGTLVAVVVGQVTRWLLEAGEVPTLGVRVDAPDNATTGFYATALAVMLVGLVVELVTGSPNPAHLAVFVTCGAVCFQRGFRRDLRGSDAAV